MALEQGRSGDRISIGTGQSGRFTVHMARGGRINASLWSLQTLQSPSAPPFSDATKLLLHWMKEREGGLSRDEIRARGIHETTPDLLNKG